MSDGPQVLKRVVQPLRGPEVGHTDVVKCIVVTDAGKIVTGGCGRQWLDGADHLGTITIVTPNVILADAAAHTRHARVASTRHVQGAGIIGRLACCELASLPSWQGHPAVNHCRWQVCGRSRLPRAQCRVLHMQHSSRPAVLAQAVDQQAAALPASRCKPACCRPAVAILLCGTSSC